MNSLRRIFSRTIAVVVLNVLAIACIAAAIYINIEASSKQNDTEIIAVDNTTGVAATEAAAPVVVNYWERQENNLNNAVNKLSELANQEISITSKIDRYIELRYNYSDGPDKEQILNALSGITRKSFLGTVDNALNYLTGNSEATIIKRFTKVNEDLQSTSYENKIETFIYIVNINGENQIIEYTMFNDSGKWVIYSEDIIGSVSDNEILTKELNSPNVKSTDNYTEQDTEAQDND